MQISWIMIQGSGCGSLTAVVLKSPCQSGLMTATYFEMYQKIRMYLYFPSPVNVIILSLFKKNKKKYQQKQKKMING